MSQDPFSVRHGLRPLRPLVFDDAPEGVRMGIREVLEELGYGRPTSQRALLCKAMRKEPDPGNWSDPNVDWEVRNLLLCPWYEFYDAVERIPRFLPDDKKQQYREAVNRLFREEGVGYQFEEDELRRVGSDEFASAVETARSALSDPAFAEPKRQFEQALAFRSSRPPDWSNAIKEAVNSVEALLQIVFGRAGVGMSSIVTNDFPSTVPGNIKALFQALYGQGSGTTGARHAAIGGNMPTAARAELAIHVAAALHAYTVTELTP